MSHKFEFTPRDDSMRRPPALTKCVDCGCCYADLYADNDPICWACDANEPCKGKLRALSSPSQPQPSPQPAPVQEKPMGISSTHPRTHRISDEIKAAIVAAAPTVSNADLARKYGISDATVCQLRKKAGIVRVKRQRSVAAPKHATSEVKKSSAAKIPAAASPLPTHAPSPTVTVALNFTPEQLEAVWGLFSLDVKVVAIAASLQSKVEAA